MAVVPRRVELSMLPLMMMMMLLLRRQRSAGPSALVRLSRAICGPHLAGESGVGAWSRLFCGRNYSDQLAVDKSCPANRTFVHKPAPGRCTVVSPCGCADGELNWRTFFLVSITVPLS